MILVWYVSPWLIEIFVFSIRDLDGKFNRDFGGEQSKGDSASHTVLYICGRPYERLRRGNAVSRRSCSCFESWEPVFEFRGDLRRRYHLCLKYEDYPALVNGKSVLYPHERLVRKNVMSITTPFPSFGVDRHQVL